jgi:hypothetical protein
MDISIDFPRGTWATRPHEETWFGSSRRAKARNSQPSASIGCSTPAIASSAPAIWPDTPEMKTFIESRTVVGPPRGLPVRRCARRGDLLRPPDSIRRAAVSWDLGW